MLFRGYEAVIGLEIHAQLKTESKIFSSDSTSFDGADNENTAPVSVGMPGSLPVLNKKAVELAVKAGLALNCEIRRESVFARKNYFYPDLPKGYQISQFDKPTCEKGKVTIKVDGQIKEIRITRAHMEEDAGKSTHFGDYTLINYNRSGIPLLEIVSEPDLRSPAEAAEYARTVRKILLFAEACDGNLEEGSFRCDCNVSIRKVGDPLGTRTELKNINSFRFIEKAIEYEIERQIDEIELGRKIIQETRLYDSDKNKTFTMRTKEDAQDYRYFPDPDLLPLKIEDDYIEKLRAQLPELPMVMMQRFITQYQLQENEAEVLVSELELAKYFESAVKSCQNPKSAASWILNELLRELNTAQLPIEKSPILAKQLAGLIKTVDSGKISGKIGKTIFSEMWKTSKNPEDIIKEKGLEQVSDESTIIKIVDELLAKNQNQVLEYRSGKVKVLGFFVGQAMKLTQGQANPDILNKILIEKLKG